MWLVQQHTVHDIPIHYNVATYHDVLLSNAHMLAMAMETNREVKCNIDNLRYWLIVVELSKWVLCLL